MDLRDLGGLKTDTEGDGGPGEVAQIMGVVGSTFVFMCLLEEDSLWRSVSHLEGVIVQFGSARLRGYRMAYRDLVGEMAVRLASEDNPIKAFAPSPVGEILGIICN